MLSTGAGAMCGRVCYLLPGLPVIGLSKATKQALWANVWELVC
jgi:hypothetical protein